MMPDYRRAGRFWLKILSHFDAEAVYLPWGVVYYEPPLTDDIVVHESVHHQQRLREGAVKFTVKYFYFWWKYGYRNNPYEIEAYEVDKIHAQISDR